MIGLIDREQFAAYYVMLNNGIDIKVVASALHLDAEEFECFILNPAITQGYKAFK